MTAPLCQGTARKWRLLFVLLTVCAASNAHAQPVNVSGVWLRSDSAASSVAATGDAAFRTGDMGTGWGTPLTLTQRSDSLIVEYVFFGTYDLQPPVRLAFAIDGSESPNRVMIGHATVVLRGRASVRDSAVLVSTVFPTPSDVPTRGGTEVRQVLRLVSATQLTVETTRPGVGGAPVTIRTVYTKR